MKQLMYLLFGLSLLLAACSEEGADGSKPDEGQDQVEETTEQDKNGTDEETVEGDSTQEDDAAVKEEPAEPLYEVQENSSLKPIQDATSKAVLLTIDDAPDKHALEMAKTLKELNAPAIFFVNGHFIDTDEEKAILKEIYDLGFAIGNHTKSHPNLKKISEEEQREEIEFISNVVEDVTGERPKFFRAPFGANTEFSKAVAKENGMVVMNWTYGYDWEKEYMDAAKLADIMVNTEFLRDGGNLLMHDRAWTAEALPQIVEGLRAKGYELIDPATIKGIEE